MPKFRILTPKGASFTVAGSNYDYEKEALDPIGAEIIEAPANETEFIAAAKTADAIYAKAMPISKKVIDALDTEGGVDEVEWEPKSRRIYYTGTTEFIEVFKQIDADHYQSLGKAATGAIAKTSLLVPELNRFYSAVPKHIILTPPVPQAKEATVEDAQVMVYEVLR